LRQTKTPVRPDLGQEFLSSRPRHVVCRLSYYTPTVFPSKFNAFIAILLRLLSIYPPTSPSPIPLTLPYTPGSSTGVDALLLGSKTLPTPSASHLISGFWYPGYIRAADSVFGLFIPLSTMTPPKGSRGGKRGNSIIALLAAQESSSTTATTSKRQKDSSATAMDVEANSATPPSKPPPAAASSPELTPVHRNTQSDPPPSASSTRTALFRPAERKHVVYFDLLIQPAQSTSETCTASHRAALVKALKALQEVDNTLSLFPYGQTDAPEELVVKEPDSLGPTIASLSKYCKNFYVRNSYSRMLLQVLLGFDQDADFILSNANAVLKPLKAGLYSRPLQTANTKTLGWLFASHENTDLRFLTTFLESQMKSRTSHPTPLLLGLKYKPVWDGTNKSEQTSPGVRAVHIDCVHDEEALVMPLLRLALKSPAMSKLSNLPLRLIPIFHKSMPLGEQDGIRSAIAKHRCLQAAMQSTTSYDIAALDRPHADLNNATLRSILLSLRTSANKVLILSIDRSLWGAGFAITYPAIHSPEATDKIVLLAKYLEHSHGHHVF